MTDSGRDLHLHPDPRDEVRPDRVAEVRQRLEAGELDSELALVETALALIDGDLPTVGQ